MRKITLLILSTLIFTSTAAKIGGVLLVGPSYTGLSSIKINLDDLEFGKLANGAIGGNKVYRDGDYYSSFGLVYSSLSFGFFGSAGYESSTILGLMFKAELYGYMTVNNASSAGGQLGLAYYF